MIDDKKSVTIYLESWQHRMLQNYLPALKIAQVRDLKRFIILKWRPGGCLASYKILQDFREKMFEVYLTDLQRVQLAEELRIPEEEIIALTISPEIIEEGIVRFE